jgi:mannose-6-phosphate isomerase-like protein (cupin superfamily)
MLKFSFENATTAKAFRISPEDSNYFMLLFDREKDDIENIFVVEIFTKRGATPPNEHAQAHEFFYVLEGEGTARCEDKIMPIRRGDALLLRPGSEHVIENTGSGKLYTLTVMMPNEGFAELIRGGEPVELDDEDRKVLGASGWTQS